MTVDHPLPIVRTVQELRVETAGWRRRGETIALVPTMGALHQGHLSLVALARAHCRRTLVSLFVNPVQFGADEDLSAYPRDEASDAKKLARAGADLLYAPATAEMYPEGFATRVAVAGLTDHLCGPHRPGHFEGVATVVTKLLLQCLPDVAVFGEKDWQQLQVIRRLARDLDIPVGILGAPTLREADGLAMSSRNAYLRPRERRIAAHLHSTLVELARAVAAGDPCRAAEEKALRTLLEAGFTRIDYVTVADAATLQPIARIGERPARACAAARLGETRLIDNVAIEIS
ncbi:MAG TPA: pantoate--beta-alanine ligase [Alphaproteobacteria bacterium]|nr:pantoate--beta-alanine ligase [Alphaproteobacteria bacterium]